MIDFDAMAEKIYNKPAADPATLATAAPAVAATPAPATPAAPAATPVAQPAAVDASRPAEAAKTPEAAAPAASPVDVAAVLAKMQPTDIVVPGDVAELRAASEDAVAEKLFGSQPHEAIVTAFQHTTHAMTPETHKAFTVELTRMTSDLGCDDADVRYIVSRGKQLESTPIDPATARQDAVELLTRELGADKVAGALRDAQALAQRDPRVASILNSTGLGNDPRTVLMFAKRAMQQRAKGRLK